MADSKSYSTAPFKSPDKLLNPTNSQQPAPGILEITLLKIKDLDNTSASSILNCLVSARSLIKQHAYDTQSRFYQDASGDVSQIYILGLWPSEQAHADFLSSPYKEICLREQEELMDFVWSTSVPFGIVAGDNVGSDGLLEDPLFSIAKNNGYLKTGLLKSMES